MPTPSPQKASAYDLNIIIRPARMGSEISNKNTFCPVAKLTSILPSSAIHEDDTLISLGLFWGGQIGKYSEGTFAYFTLVIA